jgi:hypothetical protein
MIDCLFDFVVDVDVDVDVDVVGVKVCIFNAIFVCVFVVCVSFCLASFLFLHAFQDFNPPRVVEFFLNNSNPTRVLQVSRAVWTTFLEKLLGKLSRQFF